MKSNSMRHHGSWIWEWKSANVSWSTFFNPQNTWKNILENKSAIKIHSIESGHTIGFNLTGILQDTFVSHKEKLAAGAVKICINSNNISRRHGIQLAVP